MTLNNNGYNNFINTYEVSGKAKISLTKKILGRSFKSGDKFTFTITGNGPLPNPATASITPTSGKSYGFSFNEITYGKDDAGKTYTYYITEGDLPSTVTDLVKDTSKITVTVKVGADTGTGTLSTTVTYANGKNYFNNTKKTSVQLNFTKRLLGRKITQNDVYTFTLEPDKSNPTAKMPTNSSNNKALAYLVGASNNNAGQSSGAVTFYPIYYTVSDSGYTGTATTGTFSKNYIYNVQETNRNTSASDSDLSNTVLTATVTVTYNAATNVLTATFTLKPEKTTYQMPDNNKITIVGPSSTYNGKSNVELSFGPIYYTVKDSSYTGTGTGTYSKKYNYNVEETASSASDTKVSDTILTATVTVTYVTSTNTLTATYEWKDNKSVIDNYPEKTIDLDFTKAVRGRTITSNDKFTFTLTADTDPDVDVPMPDVTTKVVQGKDNIGANEVLASFGPIKYTAKHAGYPGTGNGTFIKNYTYYVEETDSAASDTDASDKILKATVTVKYIRNSTTNSLTVTKKWGANNTADESTIENYPKIETYIEFDKKIRGRAFKSGDSVTFLLTADSSNPNAPMPSQSKVTIKPTSGSSVHVKIGPISYTKEDASETPYKYLLSEEAVSSTGMVKSNVIKTGNVKVTYDEATNKLSLSRWWSEGSSEYINDTEVEVPLQVKKRMMGRPIQAGDSFTFTLSSTDANAPLPTQSTQTINGASILYKGLNEASVTFSGIKFLTKHSGYTEGADASKTYSKTYTYTIKETSASGTNISSASNTVLTAKINVTYVPKTNVLTAVVSEISNNASIYNYPTTSLSVSFTKAMLGRMISNNDICTFTLTPDVSNAPKPAGKGNIKYLVGASSGAGQREATVTFDEIKYTVKDAGFDEGNPDFTKVYEKTYTYTVQETASNKTSVSPTKLKATVTVKYDAPNNKLTADYTWGSTGSTIYNYPIATANLNFTKAMRGRPMQNGDKFTFTLTADKANANAKMPAQTTAIVYGKDNIDKNEVLVTYGPIEYTAEDSGYQTSNGKTGTYSKSYVYHVQETGVEGSGTEKSDKILTATVTVTYDAAGNTLTAAPVWGANNTANESTIENTVTTKQYIEFEKALRGREFKAGDSFTFKITPDPKNPNAPMPDEVTKTITPTSGTTATVTFGAFDYTKDDAGTTYLYQVNEIDVKGTQVNSSDETLIAHIEVTYDENANELSTRSWWENDKREITNTVDVPVTLKFTKAMRGRKIDVNDIFEFTLTPDKANAGAPMPKGSGNVAYLEGASGNFGLSDKEVSFEEIMYSVYDSGYKDGDDTSKTYSKTYTYHVQETDVRAADTDKADTILTATVTVKYDAAKNELTATYTWGSTGSTIYNYPTTTVDLKFMKALRGRSIQKDDQFTFTLASETSGAPMPAEKEAVLEGKNSVGKNNAEVTFGPISYTTADAGYKEGDPRTTTYTKTYTYTVEETESKAANVDKSDEKLTAVVTVTYDAAANELTAQAKWGKNDTEDEKTIHNDLDVPVSLGFTKKMRGRKFQEGDIFEFTLTPDKDKNPDAPMPSKVTETVAGKDNLDLDETLVTYGEIVFTLAHSGYKTGDDATKTYSKEYVYHIQETKVSSTDMQPSETILTATVTVTYDAANNELTAAPNWGKKNTKEERTIENYAQVTASLEGKKIITGREFKEGDEFTFTVTSPDGGTLPDPASVTIYPTQGYEASFTFNDIVFDARDAGKTYTYHVLESGKGDGVTNDQNTHVVKFSISDPDKDGEKITTENI